MEIRRREQRALGTIEEIARRVHTLDGYPPYMPDNDFAGFVSSDEAIDAWVATVREQLVGQVALHSGSSKEVMALASDPLDERACLRRSAQVPQNVMACADRSPDHSNLLACLAGAGPRWYRCTMTR